MKYYLYTVEHDVEGPMGDLEEFEWEAEAQKALEVFLSPPGFAGGRLIEREAVLLMGEIIRDERDT